MTKSSSWIRDSLLALGFVSLAACASSRQQPEDAVFCAKCKKVWIEVPDADDPYGLRTVEAEVMQCPDCENAVLHFFKTGELQHACAACGSELVHCERH